MALPSEIEAVVSNKDAQLAFLIQFHFVSVTKRIWIGGFGTLRTLDGREWDGLGEIVSLDGLAGPLSGNAPAGKITASGVSPDLLPKAVNERSEYQQQPVSFYLQAFQGQAKSGMPCPIGLRIMTTIEVSRTLDTRSLSINHESPYVGRNNPANGFYTDRDQQTRYPGDRFCERTPFLLFKQERWPDY
jgi:hypothetical protein